MTNNKHISLALGSGSAKGASHIGVIETLEKHGFKICAISGTSVGAIVGAYYCLGKLHVLKDWMLSFDRVKTFRTLDFSFTGGLISGKKLMANIEEHLGHARFSDTNIPFYVVATNLMTGNREIFSEGEILPAIRASISVPGVMKPFKYNGSYYVDGAVSAPVPAESLVINKHKNIVAVSLHKKEEISEDYNPSVLSVAQRSIAILSRQLAMRQMKETKVVIAPEVSSVGMFEVHKSQEMIDEGARVTEEVIASGKLDPKWKQFLDYKIFGK